MGIFDSLTNIFTGKPQVDAAAQQRAYLDQLSGRVNQDIASSRIGGLESLKGGLTGGLAQIGQGTTTARGDIQGMINPAIGAITGSTGQAAGALGAGQTSGLDALQSGVTGAIGAYRPLSDLATDYAARSQQASDISAGALGLGGEAGRQAALGAFRTDPGYDFAVNQGLDAISRAANTGGGALGGNALREAQNFGQGMADQNYQRWVQNLANREGLYSPLALQGQGAAASGIANANLTGGTGAANIYTGTAGRLSDLYSGAGKTQAGIYTGAGQSLADLASKGGLAGAQLYGDTASREAALQAQLAQTGATFAQGLAGPYTKSYSDAAAAQTGGSQNLWNLLGGGAKLLTGAFA